MSAHTPGPWLSEGHHIYAMVPGSDAFRDIATVRHDVHYYANLRLIKAAPDLGVLLRQVMDTVSLPDYLIRPISLALAAAGL